MGAKGAEDLILTIGYLLLFLSAMAILVYWIDQHSQGKSVNDLSIAKQAALIIDSARPGSSIFINKNLTVQGNKVIIGISSYEFFSRGKVTSKPSTGGTEIIIE